MASAATQDPVSADQGYKHFLDSLRDPEVGASVLSPRRFSEALNIDLRTLAEQAHVHRNTISRAPAAESVQQFLRQALRVLCAANDLCGDFAQAIFWYRNEPLAPFGYRTAEQLVSENRTEDLLRYIAALEAGATG